MNPVVALATEQSEVRESVGSSTLSWNNPVDLELRDLAFRSEAVLTAIPVTGSDRPCAVVGIGYVV